MNIAKKSAFISNFSCLLMLFAAFLLHFGLFALVHHPIMGYLSLIIHIFYLVLSVHIVLRELCTPTIKNNGLSILFYCIYVLFTIAAFLSSIFSVFVFTLSGFL